MKFSILSICVVVVGWASFEKPLSAQEGPQRTHVGIVAFYDFQSDQGPTIKDRSGVGKPVDLTIENLAAVRRSQGSLEVHGKTIIGSNGPPTKILEAIRRSNQITIEAWIRPANTKQEGPARIVTLSKNPNERNFTIGQEFDRFDARLRTTRTSKNGIPSITSGGKSVNTQLTQVVYTRDASGTSRMFVNGKANGQRNISGETTNWDNSLRLGLANEFSGDRPWQGTFFLVAIYSRGLSLKEIQQNYKAGANGASDGATVDQTLARRTFETRIAPMFVEHCFECHDATTKKGGLDLSTKRSAFAGGESGQVIVAGKPETSLLWQHIKSDEMPPKRKPLSAKEKEILLGWIKGGAVWTRDVIDPVVYAHDQRADQLWLLRLTIDEYIETVRSAVGVNIAKEAREILPRDLRADGFSNTAYNLNVDLKHIDAYAKLAEIIVGRMDVAAFVKRFSRSQALTDPNMRPLIAKMGKWLLRGPLEEHEVDPYRGISTTVVSSGGDFQEAISFIIEAMLQSPRFIYRIENQRGDGSAWPVNDYELASRLSYILWGGPPDEELMRAADAGELLDRNRCRAQIKRMLEDPRAIQRSLQFVTDWLNLDRLENLQPNREKFPHWNAQLAKDMRRETFAVFEHVVWKQNRPLSDLLNTQLTFVTPQLADHYGLEVGDDSSSNMFLCDLTGVPSRGGLLTQGSVLTIGGDSASMVTRGLFVLHDLLRGVVKDPPPCVDTTPVPIKAGLSQRVIAEARIKNEACGGCHSKFEPLAFGLEKFDGLGAFRNKDRFGNALREDGEILFPGDAKPIPYKTSAQLMTLLATSDRVRQSLTWKVTQFALGRPLVATDAPALDKIHKESQDGGGTYPSLMTAILMSDLVQLTRTETK